VSEKKEQALPRKTGAKKDKNRKSPLAYSNNKTERKQMRSDIDEWNFHGKGKELT